MKLIEIVLIMSAHCVSPVQQAQGITEAAKVQCAVVVEKDTQTGEVKVTPESAAADQRVQAALERLKVPSADTLPGSDSTIVPVAAPPDTSTERSRPKPEPESVPAPPPPAVSATTDPPQAVQAPPEQTDTPPPPKNKNNLLCKGGAAPKWYTVANGRRKYRCLK